jgi:hypothetical protein
MIVAIDVDAGCEAGDTEDYVRCLVAALLAREGPVHRVVVLTHSDNHAAFEMLRDERCDVAMIRRPLFAGHPVSDWPALLSRQPRAGAELLAGYLQEKLRVIRELGAAVVHFPGGTVEEMGLNIPMVVSVRGEAEGECPLSATLAHAVIAGSEEARERLCGACRVPREKAFVARWPVSAGGSSVAGRVADDSGYEAFAAAVCEAYEHAVASFELRDAA